MLEQLVRCATSKKQKIIQPTKEIHKSANVQSTELLEFCLYKVLNSSQSHLLGIIKAS